MTGLMDSRTPIPPGPARAPPMPASRVRTTTPGLLAAREGSPAAAGATSVHVRTPPIPRHSGPGDRPDHLGKGPSFRAEGPKARTHFSTDPPDLLIDSSGWAPRMAVADPLEIDPSA